MTTYFDTVKRSFTNVTVNEDGVNTEEFLEASEGVCGIFDRLGSSAFNVVKSDLEGNIKKVGDYHTANPDKSKTLEQLVISEKNEKKRPATQGLLWLLRGLHFTLAGLQESYKNKDQELKDSFQAGYEYTLKPHHSFVVRPVFALAMNACPYRKDFYEKLGSPPERVESELKTWSDALDAIIKRMNGFYEAGGHAKGL
ncbi:hypothetical protein FRC04_005391 [Tulasnella sp. 424]|nr:hypothetical protein FRC04_005391 [Tulasnella sp. 424]KAG8964779.1 hypothetical protein FRC05_003569 [Tulasnella sp. 425]